MVGVGAVLIGGCTSTGPSTSMPPPEIIPPVTGVPWSDGDLQFLQRALTVLEEARPPQVDAVEPPVQATEISLGTSATVTELVLAASFSDWESGRTVLVDAEVVEERAAARIDRVVLRLRGSAVAGYLDVDSGRLPAALGLHWAGWERLGLGRWREPDSRLMVTIPRRGGWSVVRGQELTDPLKQTIGDGAVARLAAAGARQEAGSPEIDSVPVIVWVRGLAVAGIPPQVVPSQLALLLGPDESASGEGMLAHVVLPFASERDARIALVASRLVLPGFLQEIGVERGPGFDILRDDEELYLVNVAVSREQVTVLLKESVDFMTEGSDQ